MFFGVNIVDFVIFIVIIALAEAIYSPMINVFTFNFTRPGREGTFLTLSSAPIYFTMAITGLMGGFLLEEFYPAEEDETHHKRPNYIWAIIIVCSSISCIVLFFLRDYFTTDLEKEAENSEENDGAAMDKDNDDLDKSKNE
jgi:hypothetical protein